MTDGVYILLGPVRKEDWAAEEVRARRLAIKRKQINAAENQVSNLPLWSTDCIRFYRLRDDSK